MIKAKELVYIIVWFLALAAVFALYVNTRPASNIKTPTFIYEEVKAQRVATRVVVEQKPISPITSPLPIMPPKVLSQVLPEYPASALEKGREGLVMIQAYIGSSGNVGKVEIKKSSGNPKLDEAAINAVALWKFSPATKGSASLASLFEVPVRFSIK